MLTSRRSGDDVFADLTRHRSNILSLQIDPSPPEKPKYPPDDPVMIRHIEAACSYGNIIERMAVLHGLLPSVIAGLGSRQSGWGLDLSPIGPDGSKDFVPRLHRTDQRQQTLPTDGAGFGRGLMLLDYDRVDLARNGDWRDPEANIEAACQAIGHYRRQLRQQTTLQGQGLLRASFAVFDCGIRPVQQAIRQGLDVDHPTKARSYGRDILERAGFFQAQGWD